MKNKMVLVTMKIVNGDAQTSWLIGGVVGDYSDKRDADDDY